MRGLEAKWYNVGINAYRYLSRYSMISSQLAPFHPRISHRTEVTETYLQAFSGRSRVLNAVKSKVN